MKNYLSFGLFLFTLFFINCNSPEFVSLNQKPESGYLSGREAMEIAKPHLDVIFHIRCQSRSTKDWCNKKPEVVITQKGEYFCVVKDSYPFKTTLAYWDPCVRIHRKTGKVFLPKYPDID